MVWAVRVVRAITPAVYIRAYCVATPVYQFTIYTRGHVVEVEFEVHLHVPPPNTT